MAFKFIEEFEPFLKSDPYAGATHLRFYLGSFMVEINVDITPIRVGSITFYDGRNTEKFVSFKKREVKKDGFITEKKEYTVAFSDTMSQGEKQSLYSRVKALIKKGYKKFSFYDDYEYVDFDNDPRFPGIKSYVCGTEHLWLLYLKSNRELHPALDRDIKRYLAISVRKWGATCFVLHDPSIDPFRFLKPIKQEANEKIQPITDEEELDAEREHQINDDYDIVENTTNTDENNHGGDSVAHEVEDGDSRDNGITEKNGSDNSAVSAPDTADDTSKDNSTDGFQGMGGESGGDSVVRENSIDTQLGSAEGLSLSNGEDHPHTIPNPDETAGSQEGNATRQDGEGKNAGSVALKNAQKSCGEGVLSLIDDFLNEREYNEPRAPDKDYETLLEFAGLKKIDDSVFKKLHKIFKKHLTVSSVGRESPTLDKKLLIKKLMSFQSPYTAFKKDMQNEKVLLLVDISESMSNFQHLLPYFYKLTGVLQDIIVIINSNMFPWWVVEKGKLTTIPNINSRELIKFYDRFLKKYSIKTIVSFTDFDGLGITEMLLAKTNAEMIIMDVYSCNVLNYIPFKDEKFVKLPDVLKPYKNRITYYYGVGDIEGVLTVLNNEL